MIDKIIESKGYMIREFHAVADIPDGAWHSTEPSEQWSLNSAAQGAGGWWGGITKNMLRAHYEYIQTKINTNDITVYTVGEVTKYRMTANATSKTVAIADNGGKYTVTPTTTEDIVAKYRDEISIIISVPTPISKTIDWNGKKAGDFNVKYTNSGESPRRRPRQLNAEGTIWSISMDPFLGPVEIDPAGSWSGQGNETAIADKNTMVKSAGFKYAGIRDGQVSLSLPVGNYTAEIFGVNGRKVASTTVTGTNSIVRTNLNTRDLGAGMFFLNVKTNGASVMQQKLMIK